METPSETLERYLASRRESVKASTLAYYRTHVTSLIEFLRAHHLEVDGLAKLRRPHVEGWLRMLATAQPPYTNDTRRQFIFHVRRFLAEIYLWGWLESPPPRLFCARDLPPSQRIPWRNPDKESRKAAAPSPNRSIPDTPVHRLLGRYLQVRGATLRPGTVDHYRVGVLSLIRFLGLRFPEIDSFAKLKRNPHIEGWLLELASAQPPYANETRSKRIYTVRRFFEDIYEWDWPESPPPGLIHESDSPPPKHHLPRPLPPHVDADLMEALKQRGDLISLGLVLARRTGLRIGELCHLELDCLSADPQGRHSLRVPLGKLRSERVIPIDQETADLIQNLTYLRGDQEPVEDPETGRNVEALFCGRHRNYTHRAVFYTRLKSVAKSAGIAQNVHPHRLRHTYATELLRNGLSLPGVMKLLGHTTLKMTLRYVEVTNEDLGRDYYKAMERARHRYPMLEEAADSSSPAHQGLGPRLTIDAAFDQIVSRIQALRFDQSDPAHRRKLQRFVERLRRAQGEVPDLLL